MELFTFCFLAFLCFPFFCLILRWIEQARQQPPQQNWNTCQQRPNRFTYIPGNRRRGGRRTW